MVVDVEAVILHIEFLAFPIKTLFVPVAVAKLEPVIVKEYPPPFCPEVIDRLLTIILYEKLLFESGVDLPFEESYTITKY